MLTAGDVPPYYPTPPHVVRRMLDLAEIRADDVLADLGSGDGRIPIAAATIYGIRACGCELRPDLVAAARKNAEAAGVAHLVKFLQRDLFEVDLAEASVVTLYLLTPVNVALRPTLLRALRPGSRIVSYCFRMGTWAPEIIAREDARSIYRWTIPHQADGRPDADDPD